ncbi:MAG: hypothetical protein WA011_07690 [Lactococcus raffinolactis]
MVIFDAVCFVGVQLTTARLRRFHRLADNAKNFTWHLLVKALLFE